MTKKCRSPKSQRVSSYVADRRCSPRSRSYDWGGACKRKRVAVQVNSYCRRPPR